MPTTKICQLNNIIQHLLDYGSIDVCPAIKIAEQIPDHILKDSYKRPGYPLTRLMRQGKIEGAFKKQNGRWYIKSKFNYINKYSVRQVSTMCGYKTTKPIYDHIKAATIPFKKNNEGQTYFIENEIVSWVKSNPRLPQTKPTISVFDIYFQLKAVVKLQSIEFQIDKFLRKHEKGEDSKKELKNISNSISKNWIEFSELKTDLSKFLKDNHLQMSAYDHFLEDYREEQYY